ncbi:MAG: glycerol-3-phosphate dehydrogenase/oxidase [Polyangiales bacterium]
MTLRSTNLSRLQSEHFDVVVVGGGINGAVAAAALAGKGARVALIDRGDFAGVTSQSSSNLAWGGIKYMESFELGLVRKLCMSRNQLMRAYPSTVQEIRFFTTLARGFRHSRWTIWLGTWIYWLFGNAFTRTPRLLSSGRIAREEEVVRTEGTAGGVEYSDAYLHDNDARFVFGFVRAAMNHGCAAANYVESRGASYDAQQGWTIEAHDGISGATFAVRARALINACGPYVDQHNGLTQIQTQYHHVLSKGIHLIVDRITPHKRVLAFFADDGRLFFVIPMGPKTCIGTTDTRVQQAESGVTAADRHFVLDNINARLRLERPLTAEDVIAERCGVRPLAVKGSTADSTDWVQLSRKHVIEVDEARHHLSIFGGKLTDCLNVGEEVCAAVRRFGIAFPYDPHKWYGEPDSRIRDDFFHECAVMRLDDRTAPTASEPLSTRLWRRYGAKAFHLLEEIRRDSRMAEQLIEQAEYIRCEIEQAARSEMVTKLADFLRRRSKIAQVVRHEDLQRSEGLREACVIFFGEAAEARWQEYFGAAAATDAPSAAAAAC